MNTKHSPVPLPSPMSDDWISPLLGKDVAFFRNRFSQGICTEADRLESHQILSHWASNPRGFFAPIMASLLEQGAQIHPSLVAPLCGCGPAAIRLMKHHRANLHALNFLGENGLSLVCLIQDKAVFTEAWELLRDEGLDPYTLDQASESAFDTAVREGHLELVEDLEAARTARHQMTALAQVLDTPDPALDRRALRL